MANFQTVLRRPAQIVRRSRHAVAAAQQTQPVVENVFERVVQEEARVQPQPKAPAQVQAVATPPPARKKLVAPREKGVTAGTTTQNIVTLRGRHDCLKLLRAGKVGAIIVPINPDGMHPHGSMTQQVCEAYPDFRDKYFSYVLAHEIKEDSVLWYRDVKTGHVLIGIVVRARAILPIDAKIVSRTLGKVRDQLAQRGVTSLAVSKITRGPESGDPAWDEGFGQMMARKLTEMSCSVIQVIGGRDTRWYLEHGEMYGECPEAGTADLS